VELLVILVVEEGVARSKMLVRLAVPPTAVLVELESEML
jgi:hypothetical protein|tara:strand:- start:555 stop:671 length:117 start_codon:yes stop_codon:yes gene_type:complete